jgi:hypothetical protein
MTASKRIPPDKDKVHESKQKRKMRRVMREIKKERAASMHVLVQILWNIHTNKVKRRTEIAMKNASHKEVSELMVAAAKLILEDEASKVEAETTSIQEYVGTHCKELHPEKRPSMFPEELWKYVMDSQKDLVRERWDKYSEERLAVVMKGILDVMISTEGESRVMDIPLFRAQ